RVQNHVLILLQDRSQRVLQSIRRVELPRQRLLQLRQSQSSRPQKQHRIFRRLNHRGHRRPTFVQHLEHRGSNLARVVKRDRRVGLWIKIDKQRALPTIRNRGGQINRRGRLPHAAFLIRYRDDGSHRLPPPPKRAGYRRCPPATRLLYIGAAPRKPPRPRAHCTFLSHCKARKKYICEFPLGGKLRGRAWVPRGHPSYPCDTGLASVVSKELPPVRGVSQRGRPRHRQPVLPAMYS